MSDLIERLFASDAANALTNEAGRALEAQQAEIERLREALDRVASDADMAHRMGVLERSGYSIIRDRARKALEQTP